jgi:small-conductance mechanosensitive channel
VSIFIGVLLSLGSSSAVANVVAGVILTYMRAFKTGDYVRISDTVGTVVGSNLLVTRILTPKNVEITVPNSSILATHVTNYSMRAREKQLILNTTVTIGYDAPWRQVHALLTMAAEKTRAVLKDPAPFVLQNSLDDFYVTYELNAYTDDAVNMVYTYADLHKNIQDLFNEYGVQIMSPNYLADRPHPTVVPKERWYAAPAKQPGEAGADA